MRTRTATPARRRIAAAAVVTLGVAAAPVAACPTCDSDTGDAVRRGIREDLAVNVAATVLPFAAVGAVVLAVHFGYPLGGRRRTGVRRDPAAREPDDDRGDDDDRGG